MANKNNKISINAFEKCVKENYCDSTIVKWNDIDITVKRTLSLSEMLAFVDGVVKSCFTSDYNTYLPEVKEFAIKCSILEMYANFTLPSNIEKRYDLIYHSNAVDAVIESVDRNQLQEILNAIDDKVDNLAQANIESVNKSMNELYSAFDSMQKQFANMFAGVSPEDMTKMIGAISDGKIDESKLMEAYFDKKKDSEE